MKKIVLIISIFAGILWSTQTGYSQTDTSYNALLKKYLSISGEEQSFRVAVREMANVLKRLKTDVPDDIWVEVEENIVKTSANDIFNIVLPVYKKYLTREDLVAIVAFYETPAGKKLGAKSPAMTEDIMEASATWGEKIGKKILEQLKEKGY